MTPSPVQPPALGVTLAGRYRILEKIGAGGAGDVYRAFDERMQVTRVLKLLHLRNSANLEQISRAFECAATASQIRHPNIVRVLETGLSEFGPFVAMEDLRGEPIARLLARRGRLRRDHCFAVLEPVLLALVAAHGIGLLHGDLKPENVLLCQLPEDGVAVKVLDFGMAPWNTDAVHNPGTDYLTPEQIAGRPIDHRTDQFAACVVVFELLTNSLPFHASTAATTRQRILHTPCPTLEQMGLVGAEALSEVLCRGMSKDPQQRFTNCEELLEALRSCMQGDANPTQILSELLPAATLFRQDSGVMAATSLRSHPISIPSPESGARLVSAPRRISLPASSSRPEPLGSDHELLAPVLPARFRGRYRARAVVWQSLDAYVRPRRPADLRERILYDIGNEDASDLLLGTLQGIRYSDLDSLTQYIDLVTARLYANDVNWCRAAGREAVEGVFSTALTRSIPPAPTILVSLKRICRILAPLFDFGDWQVDELDAPGHAQITISSIDAIGQGLRLWLLGVIERALAVSHQRFTLAVTRGDGAFTPRMVIDVLVE